MIDNSVAYGIDSSIKYEGIAVLGSHPQTIMKAPLNNLKWLIYACSPHNVEHRTLPRINAWFEVHKPIADRTRAYPYLRYLESLPFVWMRDKDALPHFPGGKEYPEKELKNTFSPFHFTSSIALMLAKAIVDCETLGIRRIGLWGIMQAAPNEYTYQKPGIQYFIWEAARRDIEVVAPLESKLFEIPEEIW
jgi:hypothetical protein